MSAGVLKRLHLVLFLLLVPVGGCAQEATFTGTITDSTGSVLPGVTVTATHVDSGNTFVIATDERGEFRLPVRVGSYSMTTELSGFTTVNQSLQILVGQTVEVSVQMSPSAVQETVTVTGEAPLVDTTGSTVAANINPRQMAELPLNGRAWMDLALLAPGARRNEGGGMVQFRQGYSQTNLDGQDVTTMYHSNPDGVQPGFNRDSIAEFEVIANRFDATQGRSQGMVVNAVTKSGTNAFAGMLAGYFRDGVLDADDLVVRRENVLAREAELLVMLRARRAAWVGRQLLAESCRCSPDRYVVVNLKFWVFVSLAPTVLEAVCVPSFSCQAVIS